VIISIWKVILLPNNKPNSTGGEQKGHIMPYDIDHVDLYYASQNGEVEEVKFCIEHGKDVNQGSFMQPDEKPLMVASSKGHLEIVVMLLKAGAEVDAKDFFGRTALAHAAVGGHTGIMQELITAGADVHHIDHWRWNALTWAAAGYPETSKAAVQLLLSLGADPTLINNGDTTPQQVARGEGNHEAADILAAAEKEWTK